MGLDIRPLRADDEADWRRLWAAYIEFHESSVPEEVYQKTFERLIDPGRPQQNGMIATLDGIPVGLVHYIYHAHNWQLEDTCYLQDLYADPAVRGKGIGRALIEAVYKVADENGTPNVYWMTQEFNATARQLYDRVARLTPFIKYSR